MGAENTAWKDLAALLEVIDHGLRPPIAELLIGSRISPGIGKPLHGNHIALNSGGLLREFQEIFAGRGLEALPDPRNHVKV